MNYAFPFFARNRDETAELRDRLIVAETRALLLEDIVQHVRPPEPPRDPGGRFVSTRPDRRAELAAFVDGLKLSDDERAAARLRAATGLRMTGRGM